MDPGKLQKLRSEPETLRRHREMYERRLRELEQSDGLSINELVEQASDAAAVTRHQAAQPTETEAMPGS